MLEVGDAPANLGNAVAGVGQGHDDVVVDLGHGGSVAVVAQHALAVGVADHAIRAGRVLFQPGKQSGTEVEADARVVVHDTDDLVVTVHDPRAAVRGVTLRGDALVPVVIRGSGVFG